MRELGQDWTSPDRIGQVVTGFDKFEQDFIPALMMSSASLARSSASFLLDATLLIKPWTSSSWLWSVSRSRAIGPNLLNSSSRAPIAPLSPLTLSVNSPTAAPAFLRSSHLPSS